MAKRHSAFDMGISSAEVIARRMPGLWWGMLNPTAASNAVAFSFLNVSG